MEVNVDAIIQRKEKQIEIEKEQKKETKKEQKKKPNKTFSMKAPPKGMQKMEKMSQIAAQLSEHNKKEYVPCEWGELAEKGVLKVLSLPAGEQKEELENELKNSKDIQHLLNDDNVLFDYLINNIPRQYLYGLTYISLYLKVKLNKKD